MVIEINEMIDALEEFFNSSGHEFIVGGIAGRVEGNSSIVNVSSDIASASCCSCIVCFAHNSIQLPK